MPQNARSNGQGVGKLVGQLAADKKKTVIALCLIGVMVFMWVKVLNKKTPQSAEATMVQEEVVAKQSGSQLKISFVELPKTEGRNDVLTRNFFTLGDWRDFTGPEGRNPTGMDTVFGDGFREVAKQITDKLRLKVIEMGKSPRAFINDKLLAVGDKLLIEDGANTYECEIIKIEKNTVLIRCEGTEIQLKLSQGAENSG